MTRPPARPTRAPKVPLVDQADYTDQPAGLHSYDLGLLAGLAMAIVYGLAAELFQLTWGLIAVGFIGGIVIGGAVSRGAWAGRPHPTVRRLQVMSALIGIGAWIFGLFVAYVVSQALFPQATTPLLERVSITGFANYFVGVDDAIRFVHAGAVAAMAFMAWRGAR